MAPSSPSYPSTGCMIAPPAMNPNKPASSSTTKTAFVFSVSRVAQRAAPSSQRSPSIYACGIIPAYVVLQLARCTCATVAASSSVASRTIIASAPCALPCAKRDRLDGQSLRDRLRLTFQALRIEVRDQRIDHRLQLPFHNLRQLMNRQTDAVIRQPVLRKVVRPNLLAAIAAAHLLLALLRQRRLLLLHLHLVEPRSQHAHAFLAVFDLRLLILAAHHRIRRQVCNAHGRVRRVHALSARPRRTKCVDAHILRLYLPVHVFSLR